MNLIANNLNTASYLRKLYGFTFLILILAHGAYNAIIPSAAINSISIVIILVAIYKRYFESKLELFSGIMLLYIISHVDIINKYGGFVPMLSFGLLLLMSRNGVKIISAQGKDSFLNTLILVFIITNILGWIFRPQMGIEWVVLGAIALSGYIFLFNLSRKLIFSENRIFLLYYIMGTMAVYESIVALNTYLGLFRTGVLIFLPANSRFGSGFAEATFNHSEIFGEWSMMSALFLFPMIISKNIKLNQKLLIIGFSASILNLFLSGSRSTITLTSIGLIIIYIFSISLNNKKYFVFGKGIKYSLIGLIIISALWIPLNLNYALERFDKNSKTAVAFDQEKLSLKSIITGEGTPREGAFIYFFNRFKQQPPEYWFLGYGFGTPEYNRNAWFGIDSKETRADYHSLYLSIVITYGYIGGLAYILLFFYTIKKLINCLKKIKYYTFLKIYYYPIFGFILIFSFLLFNEYKISLLRVSTYHMLTWIWLGIAHALINTVNYKIHENSLASAISNRSDSGSNS